MVVVKEETLGGNAFLAIESTPGDDWNEVRNPYRGSWSSGWSSLFPILS